MASAATVSDRVRLDRRDGRLVAVKRADDPVGVERLHREARMLAVARLPGVVEVVELVDGEGCAELVTAYVGSHSAATTRPRTLDQAVALTTAVAGIVADLHGLGIVHARLDPTHVLIDDEGRPVLCGFGGAGLVGEPVPGRPTGTDKTTPATLRPARDVYALGRLLEAVTAGLPLGDHAGRRLLTGGASGAGRSLRQVVEAATAEDPSCRPPARVFAEAVQALAPGAVLAPPRPSAVGAPPTAVEASTPQGTHRLRPLPRRPSATMSTAATSARPGTRRGRPGARGRVVPRGLRTEPTSAPATSTPRAGPPPSVDETDPVRPHRRRGVTTAAITAAVVAMGLGVASTRVGARPTLESAGPVAPGAPAPSEPAPGGAPSERANAGLDEATADPDELPPDGAAAPPGGTAAAPSPGGTPASAPPVGPSPWPGSPPRSAPTDDGACASSRTPEAPAVPAPPCTTSVPAPATGVVIGGARYAIGEPGDEVLVGDWRCNGSLGVAVVRPAWGDVYLFEHLPEGDEERTATQVARLGRGARLETGPAVPDGCPALIGRLADGSTAVVTVPDVLPTPRPRAPEAP